MNELLKRVMAVVSRCMFFLVLFSVAQAVDTPVDANKIDEGYLVELPNKKDSDILAIYTMADEPTKTDGNVMASSTDEFGYHPITYDTAYVNITNNLDEGIHVWGNSDECYKCKLRYLGDVHQMSTKVLYMDTRWKLQIAIYSKDDTIQYCRLYYHFGEEGRYTYFVNRNTSTSSGVECTKPITINREPQDANIPIYIALAVYGGFALVYIFIAAGIRDGWFDKILCCFSTDHLVTNELGSPETASHVPPASDRNSINRQQPSKPKRLKSLDTFRGISIVLMILVNYGGGKYWFLVHARWNGLTVADLVFPWFVYIMGVSMTLSFHALVKYKVPRSKMMYKIIKRTIILFALGCVLNSGNSITYFRVPGVLQRFSISYLVVASLQWISATPERHAPKMMNKYYKPFCDILDYWYEWLLMAALMIVYSCLTFLMPIPGCPTGYIGPGGPLIGVNGSLTNCTGGAANYIDRWILGVNHIYQHPTVKIVYLTEMPHDPEGVLGSITSIFITFLGLQAGKILLLFQQHGERLRRLLIWGVVLGGIATLLCYGSKENGWIPINKNLWSTSFVLCNAGTGFILLAFCYFTIDVKNWWSGAPFYYPGMNAILLYAGHELFKRNHFPFSWQPLHHTHAEFLAMDVIGTTLWVVISFGLYYENIFLKI